MQHLSRAPRGPVPRPPDSQSVAVHQLTPDPGGRYVVETDQGETIPVRAGSFNSAAAHYLEDVIGIRAADHFFGQSYREPHPHYVYTHVVTTNGPVLQFAVWRACDMPALA